MRQVVCDCNHVRWEVSHDKALETNMKSSLIHMVDPMALIRVMLQPVVRLILVTG
jgi:hypothetical protein